MINNQDLKIIEDTFYHIDTRKKVYIAKFEGHPVKLWSGKWHWASIGAAKNAINNHLECSINLHSQRTTGSAQLSQIFTEEFGAKHSQWSYIELQTSALRRHLEEEGILKYEELLIQN